MATAQHNSRQDQFADGMPRGTERGIRTRKAHTDADATVGGDDLEYDVQGRICHGHAAVIAGFCDGNEEDRESDPPKVMAQLGAQLLVDEVTAGCFGGGCILASEQVVSDQLDEHVRRGFFFGLVVCVVVGVDPERALFVYVCVSVYVSGGLGRRGTVATDLMVTSTGYADTYYTRG